MPVTINHAFSVAQFYALLTSRRLEGIRPMAALASDVHRLYLAWGARENVPVTHSVAWFCKFLNARFHVLNARKRHADGPVIRGPHSMLFLDGPVHARFGEEPIFLGEQIADFRAQVERYLKAAESPVPERGARVGARVG